MTVLNGIVGQAILPADALSSAATPDLEKVRRSHDWLPHIRLEVVTEEQLAKTR